MGAEQKKILIHYFTPEKLFIKPFFLASLNLFPGEKKIAI